MGTCWNCNTQITLKNDEVKCDNCGKVVTYPCHSCKNWFLIDKTNICLVCGFYICPECGACGTDCQKEAWQTEINKILAPEINYHTFPNLQDKVNKLLKLIEEIKINKDRRECIHGVPISYAKSRIKKCAVKIKGYKVKNEEDRIAFNKRFKEISDIKVGDVLTINQSREAGSYGQEYRDVFNLCICLGKLKIERIKKIIDNQEVEIEVYTKTENAQCPYLDLKDLIVKICPNCKNTFGLENEYCSKCYYKKGKNKGEQIKLKIKISNKDTCQLNRGEFEKNGGNRP